MAEEDDLFAAAIQATAVGDTRKARRLLRQASESGHLPAMIIYAAYLEQGVGGKADENKALTHYRKAVQLGEATACLRVAKWHVDRKQVPQAKAWLHKSYSKRVSLAEIRLNLNSRSCKMISGIKFQLLRIQAKPEALTASERIEVEALILAYEKRRPNVADAQAGRDKMREAKRRQRETSGDTP